MSTESRSPPVRREPLPLEGILACVNRKMLIDFRRAENVNRHGTFVWTMMGDLLWIFSVFNGWREVKKKDIRGLGKHLYQVYYGIVDGAMPLLYWRILRDYGYLPFHRYEPTDRPDDTQQTLGLNGPTERRGWLFSYGITQRRTALIEAPTIEEGIRLFLRHYFPRTLQGGPTEIRKLVADLNVHVHIQYLEP